MLACSAVVHTVNKVNDLSSHYYTAIWLDKTGTKIRGSQWKKALFCPPGGRSCHDVTSWENYKLLSTTGDK